MKKILIFILFSSIAANLFAQNDQTDVQLAYQYFQNKEFNKAVVLYEKLYKNSRVRLYFEYYVECLIALKNFKDAESVVKKEIKKNNDELTFYVLYGYIFKLQEKPDKATEQYKYVLKNLPNDRIQIVDVANAFILRKEFDYAEKTYLSGKEKMGISFAKELAELYVYQGNTSKSVESYLDYSLENNDSYEFVQAIFQDMIFSDSQGNVTKNLRTALLRRTQKFPQVVTYSELLIWLLIQEKDFKNAIFQAKAIDKRNEESGKRLIEIAALALANKNYDAAIEAYDYVIEKGATYDFYNPARFGKLDVFYTKVVDGLVQNRSDIEEIEKNYLATIEELRNKTKKSMTLVRSLAHLQAFYLNKPQEAIKNLQEAIKTPGIRPDVVGGHKIELADVMLLTGDIWEATLLYGQAEMDNKTSVVGDEAKFKKAKLAFYTGEFRWAKAQLDALKASTSKLIANDALDLSLLISENLTEDSLQPALEMYARADLLLYQNKDSLAILTLDSLIQKFATNSLCDEAWFKKGNIFEKKNNFTKSLECYQKIIENFSFDIWADDSYFRSAEIYNFKLNDKAKAKEFYKEIIMKFPNSTFCTEARKRFNAIQ